MLFKKKLLIFPTSRAIRNFITSQKGENALLPFIFTIDEFFKKSIFFDNMKYCEEEQRVLFLNEAIKDINISKLGISDNFTKFLKQSDYIYRFFLELASEKIEISDIQNVDTYDFYFEHLQILQTIQKNYIEILEKNSYVDRINLNKHYKINENFLKKFENVELYFEGYFTKVEFDMVEKISKVINLNIVFYSNIYNQKSLEVFKNLNLDIKLNHKYKIDLSNKIILEEEKILNDLAFIELKGFSSRLNQIAYIKSVITKSVQNGVNPSNIALVLPDESFAVSLQLFDDEKYNEFEEFVKSMGYEKVFPVSVLAGEGIKDVINEAWKLIQQIPREELEEEHSLEEILPEIINRKSDWIITEIDEGVFEVEGQIVDNVLKKYVFNGDEGVVNFLHMMRSLGMEEKLEKAGAKNGDTIVIATHEFEYIV